ncbi:unnamed protein product, partial [Symbiodinium sp. CCMP2456]
MEGKRHTLCMRYQNGQCKDTHFNDQRDVVEEVSVVPLCEHFSRPCLQASHADSAVSYDDAYFNLGAFSFDNGARSGIFQRTEQFSDVLRFLNAFMQLQFPSATWTSLCVSHNVLTLLHTDAGNVWMSPPWSSAATLVEVDLLSAEALDMLCDSTYDSLLRTPEYLNGVPGNSTAQQVRVITLTATLQWQDGGGIYSLPDWSDGPRYHEDKLQLHQHVAEQKEAPLFTESETAWLRSSFQTHLSFQLCSREFLLALMEIYPAATPSGAESDPGLLQELIQEEIDAGFLEEMPSLEDIQAAFPAREDSSPVTEASWVYDNKT